MVGIVGILLLGSLAWSAVGALFSAIGEVTGVLAPSRPTPTRLVAVIGTATPIAPFDPQFTATPAEGLTPGATRAPAGMPASGGTVLPTNVPALTATALPALTATALPPLTATAVPRVTPTVVASGRAPWILLPQPEPGGRVAPGAMTIEARGRGDAPITGIRLELDGAALQVALEQRSESTWRGSARAQVSPGQHNVRATVTDKDGRTGSFRWTFDAGN